MRLIIAWLSFALMACANDGAPGATIPLSDTAGGADAEVAADVPETPEPGKDVAAGEVAIEDAPPAETAAPDVPQEDAGPIPEGCCLQDADCPAGDDLPPRICVGHGLGQPEAAGVCRPAAGGGKACWRDGECAAGETCHGALICGCGGACEDEHPGVCVRQKFEGCAAVDPGFVEEICDAASVVIFDGLGCIHTCPGCCGCQPFCDLTFDSIEECEDACSIAPGCATWDGSCDDALPPEPWWAFDGASCVEIDHCVCEGCPGTFSSELECLVSCAKTGQCSPYVTARAECAFDLVTPVGVEDTCPTTPCRDAPCETDDDCAVPGSLPSGDRCVTGSCVDCAQDTDCGGGQWCRGGRCVPAWPQCPAAPPCTAAGCKLVRPSEVACPVCVCDSDFGLGCVEDDQCQSLSGHPYKRCVYGRCAECRNDADCTQGQVCLPPGLCYDMTPHPQAIYGTWLVGWYGGLDHFSYLRFEPDGTLRRGSYVEELAWMDDQPPLPCWPEDPPTPLLGTWEPEITASGFLVVRVSLNVPCAEDQGFQDRWLWELAGDGTASITLIDGEGTMTGIRVSEETCLPDMSLCEPPP